MSFIQQGDEYKTRTVREDDMVQKLYSDDFFISHQQTIVVEPRMPQYAYPEHTHDFDEIVIVTGGSGTHILNGRPYDLYPRMVYYIKASDHHLYENVNDLHLTNILYRSPTSFNFLSNVESLLPNRQQEVHTHWCMDKNSHQGIERILSHLSPEQGTCDVQQESAFLQLLVALQNGRYNQYGDGNNQDRISQILRWLQHHFMDDIDWHKLAEQFSLSTRTLHRHIKKDTGYTPQSYVTKLRLSEAYYQLRYSEKSITTIALDCGFNDSAYFSTCFKNEFRVTPRALRSCSVEKNQYSNR